LDATVVSLLVMVGYEQHTSRGCSGDGTQYVIIVGIHPMAECVMALWCTGFEEI